MNWCPMSRRRIPFEMKAAWIIYLRKLKFWTRFLPINSGQPLILVLFSVSMKTKIADYPRSGRKMAMIIKKKKILRIIAISLWANVLWSSRPVMTATAVGMIPTLKSKVIKVPKWACKVCTTYSPKLLPSNDFCKASNNGVSFCTRTKGVTKMIQIIIRSTSRKKDFIFDAIPPLWRLSHNISLYEGAFWISQVVKFHFESTSSYLPNFSKHISK